MQHVRTLANDGNRFTDSVKMIRSRSLPRKYLMLPVGKDTSLALIVFSNPIISHDFFKNLECSEAYEIETTEVFLPRYIAEVMRVPMIDIVGTYCETDTKKQIWTTNYYAPPIPSTHVFRQQLQTSTTWK